MTKPRLIDANELKDIIDGSEEFIDWQKREICECIDCCDTAYDIDKVVKQLEEKIEENPYCSLANYRAGLFEAIEIVKSGGRDVYKD